MAQDVSELHTEEIANYLYQSIADTQGTIRAIDIKIGFLLLIVFTPLVAFDKIDPYLRMVFGEGRAQQLLIFVAILFWGFSLVAQFMALFAISNPAKQIRDANQVGTFYNGDVFRVGLLDVITNRECLSKRTVHQETERLPHTHKTLVEELTFEKMKLAYIRSMKLVRFNSAAVLLAIGLVIFGVSYAAHLAITC
jgi:hypothetical protein